MTPTTTPSPSPSPELEPEPQLESEPESESVLESESETESDQLSSLETSTKKKQTEPDKKETDERVSVVAHYPNRLPLSNHELSLRNAAIEDYLDQLRRQTVKKYSHLDDKLNQVKNEINKKSKAIRKLESRRNHKSELIRQLVVERLSDLSHLSQSLQDAQSSPVYLHLRYLTDLIAQKDSEHFVLQQQRRLSGLIRLDLEDRIKTLEPKVARLESQNIASV